MVLQHGSCDSHVLCLCRCDDRLVERIEDSREVRLYLFLYNDRFLLAVFQCLLQVFNLSLQLVNLCILCAEVVDLCVEDINLALVAWLDNLEVMCLVGSLELVVDTDIELHVRVVDVVAYGLRTYTCLVCHAAFRTGDEIVERRLDVELPLLPVAEVECEVESYLRCHGVLDGAYCQIVVVGRVVDVSDAAIENHFKAAWLAFISADGVAEVDLSEEICVEAFCVKAGVHLAREDVCTFGSNTHRRCQPFTHAQTDVRCEVLEYGAVCCLCINTTLNAYIPVVKKLVAPVTFFLS